MNTERWNLLERIFAKASELPVTEQDAFLDQACGEDAELRRDAAALARAASPAGELFALLGQHLAVPTPAPENVLQAGPYLLEKPIGSGGMGDVFSARRSDDQYAKRVAVKMVRMGLTNEHLVRRFRRERQILAALEHPNIARLLDGGVLDNGCPYMVMELVEGEAIDKWVERNGLSPTNVLTLFLPVLRAVEYAHANLIVHCDLKPSNILVTGEGVPKLLDFGVARLLQNDEATTTSVAITPRYASPELRYGQPATVSSDVYSLGVVLGELCRQELDPDSDLALIIDKAKELEASSRYGSVEALRLDIERLLAGHPVTARRPTATYKIRKYVVRHRVAVALSAAAALGLVATTGIAVWQARRAEQQKVRAERVSAFLTSVLGVSPDGTLNSLRGKGASLRVIDLIDEAEKRFDREFANDPEAEAAVRYVIGSAYIQAGEFGKAKRNAQIAIGRISPLLSPEDESLLRLQGLLAGARLGLGEWAEAEKGFSALSAKLQSLRVLPGADLLSGLGISQFRVGKLDEAERSFQQCLAVLNGAPANYEPWRVLAQSNLSLVHIEQGKFQAAEGMLREALQKDSGLNDEAQGWALTNLASVLRMMGDAEKAEPIAARALEKFQSAFGAGSPQLINPALLLGWAMAERGRPGDAERLLRRMMRTQKDLAPEHYERSQASHFLGFVLLRRNRLAEARKEAEFALSGRRKVFRAPNWRIAETAGLLGEILVRLGDREAGRRLLAESAADFESVFGAGNVRTKEANERLQRWN